MNEDRTRKTIVLWTAWDVANIGDIGHTPGLLSVLEEHLPDVRLVVLANMLNTRVEQMLRKRFPRVEIHVRNLFDGRIIAEETRSIVQRGDLFIHNSNMGSYTDYMPILADWGIPFGVYGQSYFAWFGDGEEGRRRVANLGKASFFFCRDTLTLKMLKRAGATCSTLEFAPDACFGIDVADDEAAIRTMGRLGLEEKKFITVHLRTHTQAHQRHELPPGYGAWKEATPNVPLDTERADKYVRLITHWVDETGCRVLLAPETKKEIEQNRRFILDRLPGRIRASVVSLDHFWNVDEAASIFGRARVVVCHEPHSPIIALANGTPIIHTFSTEYGTKYHMFRDIGLSEWLLDHDATPAESMIRTLMSIHDRYEDAQRKVELAMRFVRERTAETMETVRRALQTTRAEKERQKDK